MDTEKKCPHCGQAVEAMDQIRYCPFCGAGLGETVSSRETGPYSPWEDRDNQGFVRALIDTWKESVFHPTKFFSVMPVKGGYGGPLFYGFIVGEIALLFNLFWQAMFMMMGSFDEQYARFEAVGFSLAFLGIFAILSPAFVIMGYFISAAVLHLCLSIVGGARRDFEATFRIVCYAAGANLFSLVPFCGGLGAWIWNAVLNIIGIRETHQISSGRAIVAYCLPALLCCGLLALGLFLALPDINELFEGWSP